VFPDDQAQGGQAATDTVSAGRASGPSSRYSLKNWRVRSRLLLLVALPTAAALVFGGFNVSSSVIGAQGDQRTLQLARLAGDVTSLVQALQNERQDTITYITLGNEGGRANELGAPPGQGIEASDPGVTGPEAAATELLLLRSDYKKTTAAAAPVLSLAGTIGSSYPALVQQQAQDAIAAIGDLPALRQAATNSRFSSLAVIDDYGTTVTQLLALEDEVAAGSNDATLADNVHVLSLISSMKEEVAQQQAIVTSALQSTPNGLVGANPLSSSSLSALNQQVNEQAANVSAFELAATPPQRQIYNTALSSAQAATAQQQLQNATSLVNTPGGFFSKTDPTLAVASSDSPYWVSSLGSVEQQLVASVISRATSLRDRAITLAIIIFLGVVLLLAITLATTTFIGRSMVGPLRRLRTGALQIAGVRLPETVQRMSETDGEGVSLEVEPINVDSTDEIGEVARAFDQVHREALRLAANEAALRGNVNAMFVNLSRRSQSLVERQLRLIDDLEQGEQDAERLSSLFQMDHLATRMRRNSENLLVLAGHEEARRWNQPVALVDVLRAALSEIEHYERVTLNVQPGIAVRGQAVSDVVHLTAELVENATSFSAAEMPVTIAGHLLSSGGVLLEITDQGVGMGSEEMAHANWRLDNPPVVDVAVSRRMGLFVVARLAAKHGIRVRLRPAASGGLTALVWLPDEAIVHETSDSTPGVRRGGVLAEPTLGRLTDGALTAGDEAVSSGWGDISRTTTDVSRPTTAEQEINASRAPRFAPLRADAGEPPSLGPKRVPGAGPRPGSGWATGPLPAFRTVPRPASDGGPEVAATGPQPAIGATGPQPAIGETGPQPAIGATGPQPAIGATGPQRAIGPSAEPPAEAETTGMDLPAVAFDSFGTGPQPLDGAAAESPPTSPQPVLGAPAATGWDTVASSSEVVMPPADDLGEEHRLPIFEAVESDWFRRGRQAVGRTSRASEPSNGNGWASPADEGWRAAEVVSTPSSGGVTSAGLPKRVPQANLVPGAVGAAAGESSPAAPARSAAATRDRFASFQRGVRQGRAAASQGSSDDAEDKGSE
jgi:signal transduction histidine kinase